MNKKLITGALCADNHDIQSALLRIASAAARGDDTGPALDDLGAALFAIFGSHAKTPCPSGDRPTSAQDAVAAIAALR